MSTKKYTLPIATVLCLAFLTACGQKNNQKTEEDYGNPAADGFNAEGSDPEAIAIADEVMEAMGGRKAWDNTRHICWNFFGYRNLAWNKHTGDVRIDQGNTTYLININDETGKVFQDGVALEVSADSLQALVDQGKSLWINDAYWLVMPYKLKDTGVTLKYVAEDATLDGKTADKLKLTFANVGRTPQNMYHVWVDKETRLVSQWAFYPDTTAAEPRFTNPWNAYKKHGQILLSGEREMTNLKNPHITDIKVFDELPESVYRAAEKPELAALTN